jgi:hypothetical protein
MPESDHQRKPGDFRPDPLNTQDRMPHLPCAGPVLAALRPPRESVGAAPKPSAAPASQSVGPQASSPSVSSGTGASARTSGLTVDGGIFERMTPSRIASKSSGFTNLLQISSPTRNFAATRRLAPGSTGIRPAREPPIPMHHRAQHLVDVELAHGGSARLVPLAIGTRQRRTLRRGNSGPRVQLTARAMSAFFYLMGMAAAVRNRLMSGRAEDDYAVLDWLYGYRP